MSGSEVFCHCGPWVKGKTACPAFKAAFSESEDLSKRSMDDIVRAVHTASISEGILATVAGSDSPVPTENGSEESVREIPCQCSVWSLAEKCPAFPFDKENAAQGRTLSTEELVRKMHAVGAAKKLIKVDGTAAAAPAAAGTGAARTARRGPDPVHIPLVIAVTGALFLLAGLIVRRR